MPRATKSKTETQEKKPLQRKTEPKKVDEQVIAIAIETAVEEEREKLEQKHKKEILKYEKEIARFGVDKFTCHLCGKVKTADKFYKNCDPRSKTQLTPVCKECCEQIVYNMDNRGNKKTPTPETIKIALEYLDKPWIDSLYDASVLEAANTMSGRVKSSSWNAYIKNISMMQYKNLKWSDGDVYKTSDVKSFDERDVAENDEIMSMFQINKRNVINALGYDPFESAPINDQPLMYSKLSGMLDESTSDDEVKLGACIEIVHSFNQAERMNYVINSLQGSAQSIIDNVGAIKNMEDTKNKIFNTALNLAKDNGITVKHSNNSSKGSNQWTGKVKEMKGMDLRNAEVNSFDIGTAEGMKQVAEISNGAIIKQLMLDESDYTEMIATQRQMLTDLQAIAEKASEEVRIFKRENKDLKDFLREKKLINENDEVIY